MLYINGKWRKTSKSMNVINPATGERIQSVAIGGREETKEAIACARVAFDNWKRTTAMERGNYLREVAFLMKQRADVIAETATREMGKPKKEAILEVASAIDYVDWYAEEAKRVYGETIPASHPNKHLMVIRDPVGVTAAITPWNFPVSMITRKIAPAIAAGCTVVLKPASFSPLSAIKVFECFHDAGFPEGVVNLVIGPAKEIGEEMTLNPQVRKLTFTGSTEIGKQLIQASASTVKKVSMELGGHAPLIVFDDADIDLAVQGVISSKFRNCGQVCVSTNRIYVSENIAQEFTGKLVQRVNSLKVGNGLEEGVDVGPLINQDALNKVQDHVDDAVKHKGEIVCGGKMSPPGYN